MFTLHTALIFLRNCEYLFFAIRNYFGYVYNMLIFLDFATMFVRAPILSPSVIALRHLLAPTHLLLPQNHRCSPSLT